MVKVFLTGGTGYIGSHAALALERHGHEVYALVRDASKPEARALLEHGVTLVVGNLRDVSTFRKPMDEASVLIHTALDEGPDAAAVEASIIDAFLSSPRNFSNTKKRVIYTTGIMVYGPGEGVRNESDAPAPTVPELLWRPQHEQRVAQCPDVVGTAVRPGWVYGNRQGGHFADWFFGRDIEVFGNGQRAYSMVHADDLGEAYARIVEAPAGNVGGEVFNIVDNNRYGILDLAKAAARARGIAADVKQRPAESVWERSVDHTVLLSNDKAFRLLGWRPRHLGFVEEIAKHYRAWKAGH